MALSKRYLLLGISSFLAGAACRQLNTFVPFSPSIARSRTILDEHPSGDLIPQQFGARGDGSDDTAALHDCAEAAVRRRCNMRLPAAIAYSTGPWMLPAQEGLSIKGASSRTSNLSPINSDQSFLVFVPKEAVATRLENLCFLDARRPENSRCQCGLLSDCAQELLLRDLRFDSLKTGLWLRSGGYHRIERAYCARASERYFAFGGSTDNTQLSESWFYELICDSGLSDVGGEPTKSIAFDIDSGAAFLHFQSPTAAGQSIGLLLHDTRGQGVASRPDGIFLWDLNLDWVFNEAIKIQSAGRVLIDGANLRSLNSFAARLSGFGSVEWNSSNAYASRLGGISIEGGFNDFYFKGGSRLLGNAWPNNSGGAGIKLARGSGRVHLEGGVIGNGDTHPIIGEGYYALGVTNRQDFGLFVDPEFLGEIIIDSTRIEGNTKADLVGVSDGGRLRERTTIKNVDSFRTSSSGISLVAANRKSGLYEIAHGLALTPQWASAHVRNSQLAVEIVRVDQRNIYCRTYLQSSVNILQEIEITWEAKY